MSVAIPVRSADRVRSTSSRRCSGGQQRQGQHHDQRRGHQHHDPQRDRGGQHQAGDQQVRRQRPERPGEDLGQRAELVGVAGGDAEHLAGRRPLRQHVAELHRLAVDHHHRAVHPISQVRTTMVWLRTPAVHPDHDEAEQDQGRARRPVRGRER
jgi:hypothetical protein